MTKSVGETKYTNPLLKLNKENIKKEKGEKEVSGVVQETLATPKSPTAEKRVVNPLLRIQKENSAVSTSEDKVSKPAERILKSPKAKPVDGITVHKNPLLESHKKEAVKKTHPSTAERREQLTSIGSRKKLALPSRDFVLQHRKGNKDGSGSGSRSFSERDLKGLRLQAERELEAQKEAEKREFEKKLKFETENKDEGCSQPKKQSVEKEKEKEVDQKHDRIKSDEPTMSRTRSFTGEKEAKLSPEKKSAQEVQPIVDKETWNRKASEALEVFANRCFIHGKVKSSRIAEHFIHERGLSTTNIHASIEKARGHSDFKVLEPFLKINDPKIFLAAAHKLKGKNEYNILLYWIGGKKALECLEYCINSKSEFVDLVRGIKLIKAAPHHLPSRQKMFEVGFDHEFPIADIGPQDTQDSFRAFTRSESDEIEKTFKINGKGVIKQTKGVEEVIEEEEGELDEGKLLEKKDAKASLAIQFLAWLIPILNTVLGHGEGDGLAQAKLLDSHAVVSRSDKETLVKAFIPLLERYGKTEKGVKSILKEMDGFLREKQFDNEFCESFQNWGRRYLFKLLHAQDEHTERGIMDHFARIRTTEVANEHIPGFRPLQALSNNVFNYANEYMRHIFCPELMHMDVTRPKCRPSAEDNVRFEIDIIDPQKGTFTVTQIKTYRIVVGRTGNFDQYAKFDVHFKVAGTVGSPYFSAHFWCDNLEIDQEKPLEERILIARSLLGKLSKSEKREIASRGK